MKAALLHYAGDLIGAVSIIGVNVLVGLLVASISPRHRRYWLRSAPSFSMFVLGLTIWPAWCIYDVVQWWRSRR